MQHEQAQRICIDPSFAVGRQWRRLRLRLVSGIHNNLPACAGWICRDPERHVDDMS